MAIKVILQQDVPNLGHTGDVKQVAPGYFRNYLQPRGLAIEASERNLKALESSAAHKQRQQARAKEQADAVARHLQDITLRLPVKMGEQGRLYGSVTNKDIATALEQQAAVNVDRHRIELQEPLKTLGMHTVPVKLDHGIEAHVKVELVPEEEGALS